MCTVYYIVHIMSFGKYIKKSREELAEVQSGYSLRKVASAIELLLAKQAQIQVVPDARLGVEQLDKLERGAVDAAVSAVSGARRAMHCHVHHDARLAASGLKVRGVVLVVVPRHKDAVWRPVAEKRHRSPNFAVACREHL